MNNFVFMAGTPDVNNLFIAKKNYSKRKNNTESATGYTPLYPLFLEGKFNSPPLTRGGRGVCENNPYPAPCYTPLYPLFPEGKSTSPPLTRGGQGMCKNNPYPTTE